MMLAKHKDALLAKWVTAYVTCMLMMVQGDISLFNYGHWQKASITATGACLMVIAFLYWPRLKTLIQTRIGDAAVYSFGVLLSDLWVHPTHFLFPTAEAIATAICSGAIIYLSYGRIER